MNDKDLKSQLEGLFSDLNEPIGAAAGQPASWDGADQNAEPHPSTGTESQPTGKADIFYDLAESAAEGIVIINPEGRVSYANPACSDLFGYNHAQNEMIGLTFASLWPDEQVPQVLADSWRGEAQQKRKDGSWFSAALTLFPIRDGYEPPVIAAIIRRQAQGSLREPIDRESEYYHRTVLDSIMAGLVIVDAETREIVDVNRAALDMIGAAKDQVIGFVCHRFICPAERGRCPICDLGQTVDHAERILLTAQGKMTPIIKTVLSATFDDRRYLIESFVDITAYKQAEAERERLLVEARRRAEEEAVLSAIGDRISRSLDVETVLKNMTAGLGQALGATGIYIELGPDSTAQDPKETGDKTGL